MFGLRLRRVITVIAGSEEHPPLVILLVLVLALVIVVIPLILLRNGATMAIAMSVLCFADHMDTEGKIHTQRTES